MIDRLRRAIGARPALLGVVGAVLLLAGSAWYQALVTPPYRFIDEQAHVGYVLAIQQGQLPTIDTPIDAGRGGPALQRRLMWQPERRRDVWVANNPPLTYLVAAGPAALTNALDLPGGPLLGLRLTNVVAACAAVALAYLLARDLAGGDRTVGLVGAGIVAAAPHVGFVVSLGFNDGTSLLATTAVTLALARVAGAGGNIDGRPIDGVRAARLLGLCAAAATLCRPMAAVFAGAAVALGFAVTWWRRQARLLPAAAWLGGPTLLLGAWWYLLNVHRYGDPTGSQRLFEKFGRQPSGTIFDSLANRGVWESALRTITTRRLELPLASDPMLAYQVALAVTVVGIAGATILIVRGAVADRGGARSPGSLPTLAWATCAVLALVPVVLTAQHRAGGGAVHPRYLFPVLPIAAAAVAVATVRLATRWAGAALVLVIAGTSWVQTRRSAAWLSQNPIPPRDTGLSAAIGGVLVRSAGLAVAIVGLAALVAAIVVTPRER